MSEDMPIGHTVYGQVESTDTPITDDVLTHNVGYANYQLDMLVNESRKLERENARLREEVEMLNVRHAAAMLHAQTHADEYNALREDEKGLLQDIQRLTEEAFKRDEKLAIQSNANVGLMEELAEAKRKSVGVERDNNNLAKDLLGVRQLYSSAQQMLLEAEDRSIQHFGAAIQEKTKREQAEARALEYKTEHAALLGTSQWQETEIADLRDDVKRLMKIASECEERALAAEKDAGRYRLLRSRIEVPGAAARFLALNNWHPSTDLHDLDAALDAIGAKHD